MVSYEQNHVNFTNLFTYRKCPKNEQFTTLYNVKILKYEQNRSYNPSFFMHVFVGILPWRLTVFAEIRSKQITWKTSDKTSVAALLLTLLIITYSFSKTCIWLKERNFSFAASILLTFCLLFKESCQACPQSQLTFWFSPFRLWHFSHSYPLPKGENEFQTQFWTHS